jgi:hypothetical protein
LRTNNKIKNSRDLYRGINDLKKCYQPRTSIIKDEKRYLFSDSHIILASWRDHFSQLLKVHGANDVSETEIHTAEPLVPEPSVFEIDLDTENLKSCKSPDIDQVPSELIKAGGKTIHYEIHKLIISIWNKEELPEEWKELINVGR